MSRLQHHDRSHERRTRITFAVITGLLSGATRAVASWLIDHLTTGR